MGVPIIVSRSGITQMGYEIAKRLGMCLFGRATNKHFICYCGFERFAAEPALAVSVMPGLTRHPAASDAGMDPRSSPG
jgi:FdhD protein